MWACRWVRRAAQGREGTAQAGREARQGKKIRQVKGNRHTVHGRCVAGITTTNMPMPAHLFHPVLFWEKCHDDMMDE